MKADGEVGVDGRAQDIDRDGADRPARPAVDDAEAAPGQTGVDPEHPHDSPSDR